MREDGSEKFERSEQAQYQHEARQAIDAFNQTPGNIEDSNSQDGTTPGELYTLKEFGENFNIPELAKLGNVELNDPKAIFEIGEYLRKNNLTADALVEKVNRELKEGVLESAPAPTETKTGTRNILLRNMREGLLATDEIVKISGYKFGQEKNTGMGRLFKRDNELPDDFRNLVRLAGTDYNKGMTEIEEVIGNPAVSNKIKEAQIDLAISKIKEEQKYLRANMPNVDVNSATMRSLQFRFLIGEKLEVKFVELKIHYGLT